MRLFSLLSFSLLIGCPDPNASSSGMETTTTASGGADPQATTGSQETDPSAAQTELCRRRYKLHHHSWKHGSRWNTQRVHPLDVQKVRKGSAPMLVHTLEMQSVDESSLMHQKDMGPSSSLDSLMRLVMVRLLPTHKVD